MLLASERQVRALRNVGSQLAMLELAQQLAKGKWTTDPLAQLLEAWETTSKPDAQAPENVYFGQQVKGGKTDFVTIRVGNEAVSLDTPSVARVGPVASAAGFFLDRSGLSTPRAVPRNEVSFREYPQRSRVEFQFPDGSMAIGKTDVKIGRPADLSSLDQWRHFKSVLKK